MKSFAFIGPLLAVILPFILFESFHNGILADPFFEMPRGHFYIVSIVSVLSTMISIAVGIAGNRVRNIKVSFLALSFFTLGLMFSVHGLSTPHFIMDMNHIPAISAQLSLFLATIWLWLSSLPSDNKWIELLSRKQNWLLPSWAIALSIFAIIGMIFPTVAEWIPLNVKPLNVIIMTLTILLNAIAMYRYYRSYRYSRFPLQIAIVYCTGWFMVSQWIMVRGELWRLSWWIYHFLLLASMVVMLIGLVKQYAVKGTMIGALKSLFTNDPFERITNSIVPSVKALIMATEKKDIYTAGHTLRVTMYALKLAEGLHLKPEQLRALVQGGLLHDVGKINVPDTILNKPGKLLPDERALIEEHPVKGYEMCRVLGIMKEELSIIRSHHEKWDGSGYPDRLKGEEISFYARIVAVADVYDALTSDRSYRKAWPHSKAMDFIIDNKGSHFDPQCVDAWVKVCEQDPRVYQIPSQTIKDETTAKCLATL
ncbi:HD-GYP domain-containing protein [Bacillus sp. 1NLA3E]|uniref:HD-GYP domain-containing protein n=1 Tax=Bacillus sp. 1NLA3E TaxID=666686 RepID=UPI000247E898|nr:HD-GYP domain-containing protein [Bacillus sp. 1NLA3E]AGK53322.1 metal dependent phosphohydrolase [Bacillus sp. 1NLA3E]